MYLYQEEYTIPLIAAGDSHSTIIANISKAEGVYIHAEADSANPDNIMEVFLSGRIDEPLYTDKWIKINTSIFDDDTEPLILELETTLKWIYFKFTAPTLDLTNLKYTIGVKGYR